MHNHTRLAGVNQLLVTLLKTLHGLVFPERRHVVAILVVIVAQTQVSIAQDSHSLAREIGGLTVVDLVQGHDGLFPPSLAVPPQTL